MNRIKFSEDWDKLAEPRFTTIRSYRASKETYYRSQIGKTLTLWRQTGRSVWNGHKIGQAVLLRVEAVRPRDLPVTLLIRDVTRAEAGRRLDGAVGRYAQSPPTCVREPDRTPRAERGPNMKGDSIPTPTWLEPLITGCGPYPLNETGPLEPPPGRNVWVNPGFSRKAEAIENAIRWHREGHAVVCYLPIETSTLYAKRLIRSEFGGFTLSGVRTRLPGIEIVILTGEKEGDRT